MQLQNKTLIWRFAILLLLIISFLGCIDTDSENERLVSQRVQNFPAGVEHIILEDIQLKRMEDSIDLKTLDVFHPAINEIEPDQASYVDTTMYNVFVGIEIEGKEYYYFYNLTKRLKIITSRMEKSWPVGVQESRRLVR